jgi:hypothetical protein
MSPVWIISVADLHEAQRAVRLRGCGAADQAPVRNTAAECPQNAGARPDHAFQAAAGRVIKVAHGVSPLFPCMDRPCGRFTLRSGRFSAILANDAGLRDSTGGMRL